MEGPSKARTAVSFILLLLLVAGLSALSTKMWGGKPEEAPRPATWTIDPAMTVRRFGEANGLPNPVLKEIFGLRTQSDLEKRIDQYGSHDQIASLVTKKLALASEHASKNWVKIPLKFLLWFAFLLTVFILFRKRKVTPALRLGFLLGGVLLFGVVMGSDPSPMGTVKDAIHLYGTSRAIFPPRVIALCIFLAIVFLANKYICAWGCQAGVLQDVMFRMNQTGKEKAVVGRRVKLPFVLTNSVRVAFFGIFTVIAFAWGADIIDPIDPFKIYKPMYLGLGGAIFIALLLCASLFIYRPWCHLFCPFGLVGWLLEKVSLTKISVAYGTCIACGQCATACPSTVMGAILRRDKATIPDCFACYTCRDVCPTNSIAFSSRKRTMPPPDHFAPRK